MLYFLNKYPYSWCRHLPVTFAAMNKPGNCRGFKSVFSNLYLCWSCGGSYCYVTFLHRHTSLPYIYTSVRIFQHLDLGTQLFLDPSLSLPSFHRVSPVHTQRDLLDSPRGKSLQQLAKAALCLPCSSKSQDWLCFCPYSHVWLLGHFTYLPATPACSLTPSLAHPSSLHLCTVSMWDSWSHGRTDTEPSMRMCVHNSSPFLMKTIRNGV